MARAPKRTPKPSYADDPKRLAQGRVKTNEFNQQAQWRVVVLLGDSNAYGSGVSPGDLPSPPDLTQPIPNWNIYDRLKLTIWDDPNYMASIRSLSTGYGVGLNAPWVNDSNNVGPEWFIAERIRAYSSANTLVIKLTQGGTGTGYRSQYTWNPDDNTENSLAKILEEAYWEPAMQELRERVGGDENLIASVSVVSLIGTNDAAPAETAALYGSRMLGLIKRVRYMIKPDSPDSIPWLNILPPLYKVNGEPFGDIESIRAQCERLGSQVNVTTQEIPNPETHPDDTLHLNAVGCRSAGYMAGDWILSVSKFA